VDIDEDMLAYLTERSREEGRSNVEIVRAGEADMNLPDGSIDLLFTCNTYHHLSDRPEYFRRAARTLRPGGRVAVIDLDDRSWFGWLFGHITPADVIRTEMESAGYQLDARVELPRQSFLIFTRRDG
jgi:ubiquinone/menaquinone biosynthesis C-methylase UbiE